MTDEEMTDTEIVDWLRREEEYIPTLKIVADRIEELVKERNEALKRLDYWVEAQPEKDREYREEQVARQIAEAKLEKAVEALTTLRDLTCQEIEDDDGNSGCGQCEDECAGCIAHAMLAELEKTE